MGLQCVCVLEGKEVDVGRKHGHGISLDGGEKRDVLILKHLYEIDGFISSSL